MWSVFLQNCKNPKRDDEWRKIRNEINPFQAKATEKFTFLVGRKKKTVLERGKKTNFFCPTSSVCWAAEPTSPISTRSGYCSWESVPYGTAIPFVLIVLSPFPPLACNSASVRALYIWSQGRVTKTSGEGRIRVQFLCVDRKQPENRGTKTSIPLLVWGNRKPKVTHWPPGTY